MSNNRGNNRRRGRGGNRSQNNNQFPNRIDSRARGNAPQLLDKHKKLANDAQMNGDRVQAEYHLQFADHYFRVIADNKARQDEQRAKRDDNRGDRDEQDDGDDDYERQNDRADNRQESRSDNRSDNRRGSERKPSRRTRQTEGEDSTRGERESEGCEATADDNPFTKPRKPRAAKRPVQDDGEAKPRARRKASGADEGNGQGGNGLDPSTLPPSIGDDTGQDAPKPRRRTRRASGDGEAAEAVG